jgi:uncharacterized membrane protein
VCNVHADAKAARIVSAQLSGESRLESIAHLRSSFLQPWDATREKMWAHSAAAKGPCRAGPSAACAAGRKGRFDS